MLPSDNVWVSALQEAESKQLRKAIIRYGPLKAILAVCELSVNHLAGNLRSKGKRPSKRQTDFIKQLSDRSISLKRKRRFLLKPTGLNVLDRLIPIRKVEK